MICPRIGNGSFSLLKKRQAPVHCNLKHTRSLGLAIDDRLTWTNYIHELCKKVSAAIGALKRIRSFVSQSTAIQIYNALIQPHLDYCSPVWDGLSDQ